MNYYLIGDNKTLQEIPVSTMGRLITELRKFGYVRAAEVCERLREGAKADAPYYCSEWEVQALQTARGATYLTKRVLIQGTSLPRGLSLTKWPKGTFQKPTPPRKTKLKRKETVAQYLTCPHCDREFKAPD